MNPFRMIEDQRGRNLVNKSLCYESHNNSIHHNGANQGPWLNQSLDYASNITLNPNTTSFIYMTNQAAMKAQENKKL
jgi:hypothetical protein